ncbi:MAG: MFS transporter [Deltaproteobacteria bacterium]|nr:MFS transporter [Deltaproteobacteria bacterium]
MSQEDVQTEEYQFPKKQIVWGLVAIFAVYGTMAYGVQTLNIARPKIAADLDGLSLYAWSVSIPSLIMALVTIIFGKFSDIYGRRIMLMISLVACFIGTVLSALSPNFLFLIVAQSIAALGIGAMMPLVFAVVGDLFPPSKRSKWVGLLNIPLGVFTLTGPALGGLIVDVWNWRYLFWLAIPLLAFCLFTVPVGVPSLVNRDSERKIDVKGCILVALAASSSIIGFSFADRHPWISSHVLGLLLVSLAFWVVFLFFEGKTEEPVLDPAVLRNPTFNRVALATFFSSFGTMGMMMYFPMFLQGVQDISTFHSGFITTPYGVLTAFMGVPVGYIIARSNRFKWMYIAGYGILTLSMLGLILLDARSRIVWSVAVALLGGFGYGVIPTINTVVVQNTVPKRLMGVAMGAIFFFLMIGTAISPAILGSTMNVSYQKALSQSLPGELSDIADEKTMKALDDPQVLLSKTALENLKETIREKGINGEQIFQQTVEAIRHSLEKGLRNIFWIGLIMMIVSFLIICTVPREFANSEE